MKKNLNEVKPKPKTKTDFIRKPIYTIKLEFYISEQIIRLISFLYLKCTFYLEKR